MTQNSKAQKIVIALKKVSKAFEGKTVISHVSFEIFEGEIFVIMGCSGSGKSTLLRLMNGIIKPEAGHVFIKGRDILIITSGELDEMRKGFGMLFQYGALLDSLTVEENVQLPLREHTCFPKEKIKEIAQTKLSLVGLQGFEHYYPAEISGGMKKRVGLARAIALDPEIVLYDEPTAGLDPVVGGVITKLIKELRNHLIITSVVVTHDMHCAFKIADRIAMIHAGEIIEIGTPQEIRDSNNPYIQQFIHGNPVGPIDFSHEEVGASGKLDTIKEKRKR